MSSARVRALALQLAEHLVPEVVVEEVVGRHRLHGQREPQQAIPVGVQVAVATKLVVRLLEYGDEVLAVVRVLGAPAVVVDADHRRLQLVRVEAGGLGDPAREDDRSLAERHGRDVGVGRHRLRNDVDRVGVVEDPRVRGDRGEVVGHVLHHGDRPQRHEEAARPLRLLADHTVLERDALVECAGLEPAWPEARQHRIDVAKPLTTVGRRGHSQVEAGVLGHLVGQQLDQGEPLGVQVDEDDLGAVELRPVVHERRHRSGGTRRASAEVGQLDPGHRSSSKNHVGETVVGPSSIGAGGRRWWAGSRWVSVGHMGWTSGSLA